MTEIEKLVLQVESQGATATQQQVDKLDSSVRKASTSFGGLKAASLAYYGAALAVAAVVYKVGKALIDATVEYQDFNAQLTTATGSSQNAAKAYAALVDFAAKTPFSLGQAINSFSKLVNAGLNPSERALYSFSNTASATGHTLDELTFAVIDAVNGIDKPLEQFYIKAIRANGNVIFNFRGVTTQVKDNAKAIQDYIINIGETAFKDATVNRMKTLGGILSNVADSWRVLMTTIVQQGPDTFFSKTFSTLGDNLDKLNAQLKSGELQATILAYWNSWKWMWDNLNESITSATGWIEAGVNKWSKLFDGTDIDLKDIFSYKFPSYVKQGLELVATYFITWEEKVTGTFDRIDKKISDTIEHARSIIGATVDKGILGLANATGNSVDSLHNRMAGLAKPSGAEQEDAIYGAAADAYAKTALVSKQTAMQQLADSALVAATVEEDYANFIKASDSAATKQQADSTLTADKIMSDINGVLDLHKTANAQIKESYDATSSNILFGIGEQVNAETDATKKALDDAKAQGAAWKAANAAKTATSGDKLAQFQVIAPPSKTPQQLAADAALEKQLLSQNLKDLEANITTEGQVIGAGYEAQKETILSNTATTEQEKKDLIIKALQGSLTDEMSALTAGYDKRREFILSDTALTENAKTDLMKRLTASREAAVLQLELKTQKVRLDQASEFFGNIASIGSTFGEKGFKIAKAAAIAQATIKTYEAATAAYASLAGIPYIGPELGIAAAGAAIVAGAANIAQIKAQQFTPAYAMGGMIPAGRYGIVGEAGPELIAGPTVVTSAAATRDRMRHSGSSNVIIHNFGAPTDATTERDQNGDLLVILKPLLDENRRRTKKEITQEIHRGGSPLTQTLETRYQLSRKGS